MSGGTGMHRVRYVLLALGLASVLAVLAPELRAQSANAGKTGSGGVLAAVDDLSEAIDEAWAGEPGRWGKYAIGTSALGAAFYLGAAAAFETIADGGLALAQGSIQGDGTISSAVTTEPDGDDAIGTTTTTTTTTTTP